MEICYRDNGIGLPKDFDIESTGVLGLQLVRDLTENQLKGKMEIKHGRGAEIHLRFKLSLYKARV